VYLDDHSRVKLSSDDRDGRGNYINANYVDVNILKKEKFLIVFA
jgi:protein tyrosine phosphatase